MRPNTRNPFTLFTACAGGAMLLLTAQLSTAATFEMTASDASGTSSFNAAGNWSSLAAPSAGNDYVSRFQLRAPATGLSNYTFAGDSLRMDSGGALAWTGTAGTPSGSLTVNDLILNGGTVSSFRSDSTLTLIGNISVTAESRFSLGSSANQTALDTTRNTIVNSIITGSSRLVMNAQNAQANVLRLNANNSGFSGGFRLTATNSSYNNSLLTVGHVNGLGTGLITVDQGILNVNGFSVTVGGLAGENATGNSVQNNSNTAATITVGSNNLNTSYAGTIQDGTGTGNLGLAKTGDGALTLTGSNTFTGASLVSAGTLFVSGSLGNDSDVTVGTNGTIGGGGTIGGTLHFDSGADFAFVPGQTLTVNGTSVTFGNFGIANLFGLDNTVAPDIYTLINGDAVIDWANIANVGSANAYDLGGGVSAHFQEGSLQVVVIPEPATALLGSLGLFFLLRRRRTA